MIGQTGCSQLLHEHVNIWGNVMEGVSVLKDNRRLFPHVRKKSCFIFHLTQQLFKTDFILFVFFVFLEKSRASPPSSSHRKSAVPDTQLKILHMFHAAQSLMFDMMNMLPFQGHTSCICLCEKQLDQIILLHANPTALRQGWLLQLNPWISIQNRCVCFVFFLIA